MWSGKSNFGQYDLRWTNVEWVDPEDIEDSADPNAGPDLGVWGNCTDVLICLGNPWKSSKIHGVCGLTNSGSSMLLQVFTSYKWNSGFLPCWVTYQSVTVPLPLLILTGLKAMVSEQGLANVSFRFMLVISSTLTWLNGLCMPMFDITSDIQRLNAWKVTKFQRCQRCAGASRRRAASAKRLPWRAESHGG